MKAEFEDSDIEAIAQRVSELLKPMASSSSKGEEKDIIFNVTGLAEYLNVDKSWIYKQVSLRTVPFFKAGKYTRFRKSIIDKWIDKNMQNPLSTLRFGRGR